MNIRDLAMNDPQWISFTERVRTTLFHSPRWCLAVANFYGFEPRVLVAFDGEEIAGGLPYAIVRDFRGERNVTFPFSDVCEPVNEQLWPLFRETLAARNGPWSLRTRCEPPPDGASVTAPGFYQIIPLPSTYAEAESAFHQKQRVNTRRLERSGATTRLIRDVSALDGFYDPFCRLRKEKFRLLPQGKDFFARILESYLPNDGFVLFAELGGNDLMAMVAISHGDTLYIKYSAMERSAAELRPSNYLFARVIEEAIAQGYKYLDLGISADEGLVRFKRHLGAGATPYYQIRYHQRPKSQAVQDMESALSALTTILTEPDVPLQTAQDAGAQLYRFFV